MPTAKVIDLSHHNIIPESLKPAYDSGIRGCIHKVTQGTGFKDSKVKARWSLAKDANLLWGLYHFLEPGDIDRQAKWFLDNTVGISDQNTLFACDHEDYKGTRASLSDLKAWLAAVEKYSGKRAVIYSGNTLKEQMAGKPDATINSYKLWLAHYAKSPVLPPGFASYWLWQFAGDVQGYMGECPGIEPPTDLNQYQGSDDQLAAEWSDLPIMPVPEPVPPATGIVVKVTVPTGVKVEVDYI